jgi:hypothetical protein
LQHAGFDSTMGQLNQYGSCAKLMSLRTPSAISWWFAAGLVGGPHRRGWAHNPRRCAATIAAILAGNTIDRLCVKLFRFHHSFAICDSARNDLK